MHIPLRPALVAQVRAALNMEPEDMDFQLAHERQQLRAGYTVDRALAKIFLDAIKYETAAKDFKPGWDFLNASRVKEEV